MTTFPSTCPTCLATDSIKEAECQHCQQAFCSECAATISDEATECGSCGATFELLCPNCDAEIDADSTSCAACGTTFDEDEAGEKEDQESFECTECGWMMYKGETICGQCDQSYCFHCHKAVDEDDDNCPHCHKSLYFNCPLCAFELMAGTDQCPNCNALLTGYCETCQQLVYLSEPSCPTCHRELPIKERESARVIQQVPAGDRVVTIVACTFCGTYYNPDEGRCPECDLGVCPSCHIVVDDNDKHCPRCSAAIGKAVE